MRRIDGLGELLEYLTKRGVPGCACQVRHRGEILYSGYAGYADVEKKKEINRDTLYRIYSLTKLYTCAAVLRLVSEGRCSMEEPVSKFFPEYRDLCVWDKGSRIPCRKPLKIYNLLTMTSGIPYNSGTGSRSARSMQKEIERLEREYPGDTYSVRELTRRIAKIPLEFEPGNGWVYGFSHDILAALVECVSGKRFGEYLSDAVWKPLGLKDTSFQLNGSREQRLSVLYRYEQGKCVPDRSRDACYRKGAVFESGGGGIVSSLDDYGVFADMLCHNVMGKSSFMDPSLYERFVRNQLKPSVLKDFPFKGWGYGLGARVSLEGERQFGWYGVSGSWCLINPDRELTIVYMQQMIPGYEEKILPYISGFVYRWI